MGLFKEKNCNACGKKLGLLSQGRFLDGYLCAECFDQYVSKLLSDSHKDGYSFSDWTVAEALEYVDYIKKMSSLEFNPEIFMFEKQMQYDIANGLVKFKNYPDVLEEDIFDYVVIDGVIEDNVANIVLTFITSSVYYPVIVVKYKVKSKLFELHKDFEKRILLEIGQTEEYLDLLEPPMTYKEYRRYTKNLKKQSRI